VPRITTARETLADDLARRTRRYLVQMGIRVVCFILAVTTWGRIPAWVSWLLLIGAVVLPYVAVILANAGRERPEEPTALMEPRLLGPGGRDGDADRAPNEEDGHRD